MVRRKANMMMKQYFLPILLIFSVGCVSYFKPNISTEILEQNPEYENLLEITKTPPKLPVVKPLPIQKTNKKVNLTRKKTKKLLVKKIKRHLPKLEDGEGFDGRRPLVDPFVAGQKVTLRLNYLNMIVGTLVFEVLPMVEVNGKKSYNFKVSIQSNALFSMIYKLDNSAQTYVDYNTLSPFSHSVHMKETKQVKEARSFYDWQSGTATYWEKKVTKKGQEDKKVSWKLAPYSQNLISGIFYLRVFQLKVGKTYYFNIADAGKQHVVQAKVLKKQKINTPYGEFNTKVITVQYKTDGAFKQTGDILFWVTDDDKKLIVKIKSKIKLGSLVGELSELNSPE